MIVNTSSQNFATLPGRRALTCAPGILARIFAAGWQSGGSFGSEFFAATLAPSFGSWCRPSEICPPWASPGTPPVQPWRRSWSCRTGTCPGPWRDDTTDLRHNTFQKTSLSWKPHSLAKQTCTRTMFSYFSQKTVSANISHLNQSLQQVFTHKLLVWWHHVLFL